ncbi:MAG: branched-chain amino acid ABC transporter permease, partial [Planctomycetota bacterium]|nr:branched-chain amino acid ABC transporter permease [Planctomycetota bacterium]
MSDTIIQAVINGILIGGFYALIGMGLNCIFGVMNIVNFCHGELLMIGMYLSYFLYAYLGLDPYLAVPLVAAVMFIFGGTLQNFLITP